MSSQVVEVAENRRRQEQMCRHDCSLLGSLEMFCPVYVRLDVQAPRQASLLAILGTGRRCEICAEIQDAKD